MSWIDRFFGKKEESLPQVKLGELPSWLDARLEKISEVIGRHASSVYSEIGAALEEIKESTTMLEKAEPEGKFHLKMVKLAKTNRENMARQVRMLLENITIPQATDVKTIMAFHENATQTMIVCLENMMKSYQYTKLVFLEDSKRVIADVNALGRLLNQLMEPVNAQKNMLEAFEAAANALKNIKNTNSDIEIKEKTIKDYGERIVLLKKELEEGKKALSLLRDGESWKQYTKYMDELIVIENNARKIEAEIKGIVLPLNKALSRLKQLSDSGRYTLKPESREGLNLCLSSPTNVAPEFFPEFQTIVESNILNLTPEKTSKILEQLRLVTSSFGSLKNEYQAIALDIEQKKKEISKLDIARKENELTRRISALQEKTAALENELESSKELLASLKSNAELKKHELQQSVSVIDSKIKIS